MQLPGMVGGVGQIALLPEFCCLLWTEGPCCLFLVFLPADGARHAGLWTSPDPVGGVYSPSGQAHSNTCSVQSWAPCPHLVGHSRQVIALDMGCCPLLICGAWLGAWEVPWPWFQGGWSYCHCPEPWSRAWEGSSPLCFSDP